MIDVSDEQFQQYINDALASLSPVYREKLENVAFLLEDEPSSEQRKQLKLHCNQTLLGLYEGVPLTRRQGTVPLYPDRITLFKLPLVSQSSTLNELKEHIRHTVWHEVAHYYGLEHEHIHAKEQ